MELKGAIFVLSSQILDFPERDVRHFMPTRALLHDDINTILRKEVPANDEKIDKSLMCKPPP